MGNIVKKLVISLLCLLGLIIVVPVYAALPVDGGSVDTNTEVGGGTDNTTRSTPPVIRESSLLVAIIDNEGTAWQWKNGGHTGDRTLPYIFDGEKIHVEVTVSDVDGLDNINGTSVNVTLSNAI